MAYGNMSRIGGPGPNPMAGAIYQPMKTPDPNEGLGYTRPFQLNPGMQYQPMAQPDPNTGIQGFTVNPQLGYGQKLNPNGGMQYQPMKPPDPNTGMQAFIPPSMYPGMRSMPVPFDPNGGLQAGGDYMNRQFNLNYPTRRNQLAHYSGLPVTTGQAAFMQGAQNNYNAGTAAGQNMSWMQQPGALAGPGGGHYTDLSQRLAQQSGNMGSAISGMGLYNAVSRRNQLGGPGPNPMQSQIGQPGAQIMGGAQPGKGGGQGGAQPGKGGGTNANGRPIFGGPGKGGLASPQGQAKGGGVNASFPRSPQGSMGGGYREQSQQGYKRGGYVGY